MTEIEQLSSLEKLLLGIEQPQQAQPVIPPLRQGDPCPQCGEKGLDYNNLLQLACGKCGFVSGEAGGCT